MPRLVRVGCRWAVPAMLSGKRTLFACLAWICVASFCSPVQAASVIERVAPLTNEIGSSFTITNIVTPAEEVLVYLVEESLPPGWAVSRISGRGVVDVELGKIKWGPFFDRQPRQFTYQLTPPEKVTGEFTLRGQGVFNENAIPVTGVTRVRIVPQPGSKTENIVESLLPLQYMPGGMVVLTNHITLADDTLVYLVEDRIPAGWTVGAINQSGQFDAATRKVKWGPFLDRVERDLWCELHPPDGTTNVGSFLGTGSFDGKAISITGQRETRAMVSTVDSELPIQFKAGELIAVKLTVTPLPSVSVFLVEEHLPVGWTVQSVGNDGVLDARTGAIKWGPIFSNEKVTLTYQVKAPAIITNIVAAFNGLGSFNGIPTETSGSRQIPALISRAIREMPAEFLKNTSFDIVDRMIPEPGAQVYVVEDKVPAGWSVTGISDDGTYDPVTRKVKWGPFLDAEERQLRFTVTPPSDVTAQPALFSGTGSFDGRSITIGGQQQTKTASPDSLHKILRSFPPSVRAGRSIIVTNSVAPGPGVKVQSFEDTLPQGWQAKQISHDGTFDAINGKVKWGPYFDTDPRVLTYQLVPATNAGGPASLRGVGSFNDDLVVIGGNSAILAIANYAPFARADVFQRLSGQPLSFSVADLLANDSDPDGDSLSLADIDLTSQLQGTIKKEGEVITYSPPAGSNATDSFTYLVDDNFGGRTRGQVMVNVIDDGASGNRVLVQTLPNATVRIRFVGIPGRSYNIQATETLDAPNWVTIGTATASIRGDFEFDDTDAQRRHSRFYRSVSP